MAQARIDALLEALVNRLEEEIAAGVRGTEIHQNPLGPSENQLAELERLIKLSNLNNARKETTGKVADQGKVATMSDEQLVSELKATRDPDLFPRRGPRKGKREDVSVPEPKFCDIHTGVPCRFDAVVPGGAAGVWVCPECSVEHGSEFVSLKALL